MKPIKPLMLHKENPIVIEARKYIGTKFFFKGRSNGGLDCAGLAVKAIQVKIKNYEFLNYTYNPSVNIIKKELERICSIENEIKPGYLGLFNLDGLPQHVAIFTNNNTIIHTYKRIGKVIEEKYSNYWKNKLDTIYKVK